MVVSMGLGFPRPVESVAPPRSSVRPLARSHVWSGVHVPASRSKTRTRHQRANDSEKGKQYQAHENTIGIKNIKAWASTSYWEHWVGLVDNVKGRDRSRSSYRGSHTRPILRDGMRRYVCKSYAVDDDIGELWGLVLADGVVVTIVRYFELFREDTADEGGNMTGDFRYDK
ncbi:hypothetical protein F5141DRAFT_1068924 [Pisolithus sp. B1]|nr:hypothetical protein F5141DRAFT_1068924 [Pisolithus sp. B1]